MLLGVIYSAIRPSAGAMLLLAGWLFAPSMARAGCGDYVVVHGATQHPSTSRSAPTSPVPPETPPHCPCSGASCRPPLEAPLARISLPTDGGDPGACAVSADFAVALEPSTQPPEATTHGAPSLPTSIYHPPRAT